MKEIFDIFSKRKSGKIKIVEKPKIIVDYREKNSLVNSVLVKLGVEVEFKELKVADYIVKDVAIERKTVSDFISSMINKRLLRQLEELQQYKKKLLLIEGLDEQELYNDENIGINGNAIRGFLLSIMLKYNIPIIFAKNYEDSAKFIAILAKKQEREVSFKAKKKILNKKEQLQFIIEGFPGIGPKNARKLLEKFKTIRGIINATDEELRELLGKKAEVLIKLREIKY